MHTNLKTIIKTEILPLIVVNDQSLVSFLFPVNVSRPDLLQLVFRQICEMRNLRVFLNLALFLLLVGSGPKRSMPIEKLGSSSLVSSIFYREGKLHYSLKDDNFAAR